MVASLERRINRRRFLKEAIPTGVVFGATVAGILSPSDFLRFQEQPFISGSGIDQFCIDNLGSCVKTTYTDPESVQHTLVFLETGAFNDFLLREGKPRENLFHSLDRAMNGKYSPVVPERDEKYFNNVYLASTKINEPGETSHGSHQLTHGGFAPGK